MLKFRISIRSLMTYVFVVCVCVFLDMSNLAKLHFWLLANFAEYEGSSFIKEVITRFKLQHDFFTHEKLKMNEGDIGERPWRRVYLSDESFKEMTEVLGQSVLGQSKEFNTASVFVPLVPLAFTWVDFPWPSHEAKNLKLRELLYMRKLKPHLHSIPHA